MVKVGDKVRVPWYETDPKGKTKKVADLLGFIESIDGGYHYVKVIGNKKYDVIELYDSEFKVMDIWDPGYNRIQEKLIQKALADGEALRSERKRAEALMKEL